MDVMTQIIEDMDSKIGTFKALTSHLQNQMTPKKSKIKISVSQDSIVRHMNAGWILYSHNCRFGKVWLQKDRTKLPVIKKSFDCLLVKGVIVFSEKQNSCEVYKLIEELKET